MTDIKNSLIKSAGMLSIIPPVIATGIVLKVVEKSFQPYMKKR